MPMLVNVVVDRLKLLALDSATIRSPVATFPVLVMVTVCGVTGV